MVNLVKALMSLRGFNQKELAKKTGVTVSVVSRFLRHETEIQTESLHKMLAALGVDVEKLVQRELTKALGAMDGQSLGEDIGFLIERADPITRKTILETLISSFKSDKSPEFKSRISRVKQFRDTIKTVGRMPC